MRRALILSPFLVLALALFVFADHHEQAGHEGHDHAEHVTGNADEAGPAMPEALVGADRSDPLKIQQYNEQLKEYNEHQEQLAADTDAGHPFLVEHAIAVLTPTAGNKAVGLVHFEQLDANRVRISADVTGLTPNAQHGFHVHEFGDISKADGTGCGGHYNPAGHDHALPTDQDQPRHAGDLGNLTADANGNASFGIIVENLSIAGTNNPVLGRGVIVHAQPDDGGQPTGNAGARIAQGVIGVAK